jgi:hypothetical protein
MITNLLIPPEPIPATFVLSGSAGRTRTYNPSVNRGKLHRSSNFTRDH